MLKLFEATQDNIIDAFESLRLTLTKDDNLVFYFSGHGELIKATQRGYWIPVDARPGKVGSYLINTQIQDFIKSLHARHVLGIVDACFSGRLLKSTKTEEENDMERYFTMPSRELIMSGKEKVPDGLPGLHSPFANALINILEHNTKPFLGTLDLWKSMRKKLSSTTKAPAIYKALDHGVLEDVGDLDGEFYFLLADSEEIPLEQKIKTSTVHDNHDTSTNNSKDKSTNQPSSLQATYKSLNLSLSELKTELKKRAVADLSKAFEGIHKKVATNASIYDDFILLEARFNQTNRDRLHGLITDDSAWRSYNRIRQAFISTVDMLEMGDLK